MTESKALTEYFLILGLIFTFLLPRVFSFIQIFTIPHADVVASLKSAVTQANPLPGACALYYYVLGYYLHAHPIRQSLRRLLIPLGVLGYLLTTALTIWHSNLLGNASAHFDGIASTPVLMMSVAVFLLFNRVFSCFHPGPRLRSILLALSNCAFGVYLVHPFLIERLQIKLPPSPALLIIGAPALALLIYLLSLAISYALHRIPVLNRYIV